MILRLLNNELAAQGNLCSRLETRTDEQAATQFGRAFADLAPAQQDKVLQGIERDHATFFRMLVEHILEGFYADPFNGGNRDGVSWKMVGYRAEGGTG